MRLPDDLIIPCLGIINPMIAFLAPIGKFVVSESKDAEKILFFDMLGPFIPFNFAQNILWNATTAAIIDGDYRQALIVPHNRYIFKCDLCKRPTYLHVKKSELVLCYECLNKDINKNNDYNGKIFIFENGIFHLKQEFLKTEYLKTEYLKQEFLKTEYLKAEYFENKLLENWILKNKRIL